MCRYEFLRKSCCKDSTNKEYITDPLRNLKANEVQKNKLARIQNLDNIESYREMDNKTLLIRVRIVETKVKYDFYFSKLFIQN